MYPNLDSFLDLKTRRCSLVSTNHRLRHSFHILEWLIVSKDPSMRCITLSDRRRDRFNPRIDIVIAASTSP
jgi:hypothetical protein